MKFIVLNPLFQDSQAAEKLKSQGVHLLFCSDIREADLVLKIQGRSVDLIIGHDEEGLQLNKIAKSNPKFAEIPVILSLSSWTNEQCIEHQRSAEALNGYFRPPVEDADWIAVIDIVLRTNFASGESDELKVEGVGDVHASDSEHASGGDGGIELDGLFGGDGEGELETSGLKVASENTGELSAEAVEGELPIGEVGELPIADPIDLADNSSAPVDFDIGDAPSLEESADAGLSLSGHDAGEVTRPTIAQHSSQRPVRDDAEAEEEVDADALVEMPYLSSHRKRFSAVQTHVPLNDALIPGGSAHPPDTDTLKKYLSLRELDVATLSQQLQLSKEHISKLDSELKKEKADTTELSFLVQEQEARIKNFEKEKQIALESAVSEIQELKFEMKKRMDKIRLLEIQVRESTTEAEKIKERVRADIRKIRSREKELENRLEIMRKDSEALLAARENRIIELKRKLDLIEFNMDILQNQYEKEKQLTGGLREKLEKAAQVVRVAEGLLHPTEQLDLGDIMTQDLEKDAKTRAA